MTYLTLRRPTGNLFGFYIPFFAPQRTKSDAEGYNWVPSVDISETDNGFEVRAELPGVAKDDLHVSVKDNLLTPQWGKTAGESGRYPKLSQS